MKNMKTINKPLNSRTLTAAGSRFAAGLAVLGLIILTSASSLEKAQAAEEGSVNTQTAEVLVLLTAVHEVTSHNGDADTRSRHLAAWAPLWAEDATFVINNTVTFTGRDVIMTFFVGAPFFNNNWVGLSPSFRTEVAIHGETAEVYLECIFLNESKSIVAERALSGTLKKVDGNWLFWRMKNDPAMPLF